MIDIYYDVDQEEKDWFAKWYKDHDVIGFMHEYGDGYSISRVILKAKTNSGNWTPSGCARDCGDHYIVAKYSSYDRVSKKRHKITKDVPDR